MAQPINLNKARKARARLAAEKTAQNNRVRFGRDKAQKATERADAETAGRGLDGHKREP